MKSVGERIRQAREFRKLSGEELARLSGYKHQSGISNLENRFSGTGGNNIVKIAKALDISLQWFLNGPDTDNMHTVPPFVDGNSHSVQEPTAAYTVHFPWPFNHVTYAEYSTLSERQRTMIEGYVRGLLHENNQTKSDKANLAA